MIKKEQVGIIYLFVQQVSTIYKYYSYERAKILLGPINIWNIHSSCNQESSC